MREGVEREVGGPGGVERREDVELGASGGDRELHLVPPETTLERLFEGAKAIDLDIGMTPAQLTAALYRTLEANAMTGGVHLRLMVTRGRKRM